MLNCATYSIGRAPSSTFVLLNRDNLGAAHQAAAHRRFKRKRIKTLTRKIIASDATVLTDALKCFRGVADAGCKHVAMATGLDADPLAIRHSSGYTMLGNIKTSIAGTYRAIRKKHMIRYLAEFEWRFNHRFDLAAMIPVPAYTALRTKPATYSYLKWADYGA